MIIDAHTHIYPESVAEKAITTVVGNTGGELDSYTDGTADCLLKSMDEADVDLSVVLPIATDPHHGKGILEWIADLADRSPRLIFFGSVHPHDPQYKGMIRKITQMGLYGIKIHPAYQGFPADSKEAYALYEEALKNDLILHFHAGKDRSLPESDYTSVERFANVTKDFQGAKLILAHAGGDREWDKVLELMKGRKCYYDISFVLEDMMTSDHARQLYLQNEDYFLFGTDSPWRDQKRYVDLIRKSDFLSESQKSKLFSENLLSLIGM
ncbi:MAG: amidohydrolase family protein [Acidobacteria bacterium]|nr:amidohydrolase family protein [Acidobacteriota bacterium]